MNATTNIDHERITPHRAWKPNTKIIPGAKNLRKARTAPSPTIDEVDVGASVNIYSMHQGKLFFFPKHTHTHTHTHIFLHSFSKVTFVTLPLNKINIDVFTHN